ncbi:hypothetical protein [Brachyspira hampsonii]|uniref:Serpentine_recp domain containing protein n=1 Tax=Brachyspira hampsonii TaxID=1287055 RepID=A0AAC9TQ81_9SPIR|nr:hypothetical protein [Brachyspira hampsonii]ASJ20780.1 hypothetical protein BHAMNSH16_03605 [Brachyspira hampsonii]ELV06743.1 hypothetical protein H263_02305 [Brachyspira hampsonii 30599]MBW5380437.1 hypothetical protein [Brachyspira hampsonii]MBW5410627.1 hypothetical protein [Brachyspira hampsonii]OEJ14308.1 hypothetical protein A9496_02070 [Brachyspira hampsonii]
MKRITIILSIIFIFAKMSFAASGWQFGVMVPIGMSLGFYNVSFANIATEEYKNNYKKDSGTVGFDAGVNIYGGYAVSDGDIGISLLLDLGYAHDSFGLSGSYKEGGIDYKKKEYYTFENLSIGILPKFHYQNFAFGLGIGVKLPLYLTHSMELTSGNTTTKTEGNYDMNNIKNVMKNSVITYVKLTFDYSIYVHDNVAFLLGAYVGTDFGIDLRGAELVMVDSRNLSSFDLGIQLGLKFGENLFN